MANNNLRLCKVDGVLGYFHCWEHYSSPMGASPLAGGAPAGVLSLVFGIVELPEGVQRVSPPNVYFCDEEHAVLCAMNKKQKGVDDV